MFVNYATFFLVFFLSLKEEGNLRGKKPKEEWDLNANPRLYFIGFWNINFFLLPMLLCLKSNLSFCQ